MSRRAVDPCTTLGIERGASRDDIKKAFRDKIRKAHPDAGGSAERFQELQEAYKAAMKQESAGTFGQGPGQSAEAGADSNQDRHNAWQADWNIRDYYQWRREQVSEKKQQWDADAYWDAQRKWERQADEVRQKEEHQWPGSAKRAEEAETQQRAHDFGERRQKEQLEEALRRRKRMVDEQQQQSAVKRRDSTIHNPDWAAFLREAESLNNKDGTQSSKSEEKEPEAGPDNVDDKVVGYRTVFDQSGSIRVPIFREASSGRRYYTSPRTRKRVQLPG